MAYTLADIRNRVLLRVRDTSSSTAEVTSYINDTINDIYNEYRLPFMQATETYTVTINDTDITNGDGLPTNYSQLINLVQTTSGQERVIPYLDYETADSTNPDLEDTTTHAPSNSPDYWYFYDDTIRVFPAPSTAYTLQLRYYKKPTLLSGDSDVPEIPSQYEEALIMGAGYRVLQVKDNYDQAAILQNKYDEILQKLVVRSAQPQVGRPTIMKSSRRYVGKVSF